MVSDSPVHKPSVALALLKWPAIAALVGFVVSEILTDSVYLLQWLWFVPRPVLAGGALGWALLALAVVRAFGRRRREARALRVVALGALALLFFGAARMWGVPTERPADTVRVLHWNTSYPVGEEVPERIEDRLLALDVDLMILTDPGMLVLGERAERFAAAGYRLYRPGRFAVLSRLRVVEAVPIVAAKRGSASRVRVETAFGPLSIRAIDLPSDPRLSRVENARELAASIAGVDTSRPDILIGDFNIPGGSWSLGAFGEGYRDAFAEAGSGWGGTYPRGLPLWRIDLALVRDPWQAVRSEVLDLHGKRHRAQVIDLRGDRRSPAVSR
jgi:hypothetical protein